MCLILTVNVNLTLILALTIALTLIPTINPTMANPNPIHGLDIDFELGHGLRHGKFQNLGHRFGLGHG